MAQKTASNYTGKAAYFSSLGSWLPCPDNNTKGSAIGLFKCGILVSIISIKAGITSAEIEKAKLP